MLRSHTGPVNQNFALERRNFGAYFKTMFPSPNMRKIVLLPVAAITLVLAISSPARVVEIEPLPDRLSDEAFWRMVTNFSEEGGYFRFENFLSNELAFQAVIPALKETARPGGVYLGVGPEQNFTYVVGIQPKMAFIFD